jgi:hypothetical protein
VKKEARNNKLTHEMDQGVYVIFATDGYAKQFHSVQKHTTDQNQKGKDYAFKDFILYLIQEITDSAWREGENDSGTMNRQP